MKSRKPVELGERINKRWLGYAAAGAAGLGMLATVQPAQADIIYTPAHTTIAPNTSLALDLNHDGIADFRLTNYYRLFVSPALREFCHGRKHVDQGGTSRQRCPWVLWRCRFSIGPWRSHRSGTVIPELRDLGKYLRHQHPQLALGVWWHWLSRTEVPDRRPEPLRLGGTYSFA